MIMSLQIELLSCSKYGSQMNSISITWGLVRNTESLLPCQSYGIQICTLIHLCMKVWEALPTLPPIFKCIVIQTLPQSLTHLLCHSMVNISKQIIFHLLSWFLDDNPCLCTYQNEWNCRNVIDRLWQSGKAMDIRVGLVHQLRDL